jgi:hypothetical protein
LNQTIDLLQQLQSAVGQILDARDVWQSATPGTRRARTLEDLRARLEALRPVLGAAWRGMMRGSVAQSRAIPTVGVPAADGLPPLAMAEDEEEEQQRQERAEDEPLEHEV